MILGSLIQIAEYTRNPNLKMVFNTGSSTGNLDPFFQVNALASKLASHHPQVRIKASEPVRRLKQLTEIEL
jgi:hypothetical protein